MSVCHQLVSNFIFIWLLNINSDEISEKNSFSISDGEIRVKPDSILPKKIEFSFFRTQVRTRVAIYSKKKIDKCCQREKKLPILERKLSKKNSKQRSNKKCFKATTDDLMVALTEALAVLSFAQKKERRERKKKKNHQQTRDVIADVIFILFLSIFLPENFYPL